jgi:hypothetical protein
MSVMRTHSTLAALAAAAALPAALLVTPAATGAPKTPHAPGSSGTATGTVFWPNPVQSSGNQALTDADDADLPVFAAEYRTARLTDLDGSGTLTGTYVRVKSSTGPAATAVGGVFPAYHRDDDRFEQVMGYHWVTTAQKDLQRLGVGSTLRPVNQRQIELRINQYGSDNSFFRSDKANITLGKGGVDDGEDAEVIVHEYGHSVQDGQVPGFGTSLEAGSIGEAFGDYLAVTVSTWATGAPRATPEACVADWDSVSYTDEVPHCLRRLDNDLHYPEDVRGQVHADGRIWSRALWDIRKALGDTRASTAIVEAQFDFAPDTSFRDAALDTVAAARRLYGKAPADQVRKAFADRGIL